MEYTEHLGENGGERRKRRMGLDPKALGVSKEGLLFVLQVSGSH